MTPDAWRGLARIVESIWHENEIVETSRKPLTRPGLVLVRTRKIRTGRRGRLTTFYDYIHRPWSRSANRALGPATRALMGEKRRGRPQTWPKWRLAKLLHLVALFMVGRIKDGRMGRNLLEMADAEKRAAAFRYLARPGRFSGSPKTIERRYFQAKSIAGLVEDAERAIPEAKGRL